MDDPRGPSQLLPGYSPFTLSRQDTPFLRKPGPQGLQEGLGSGQGFALTPTEQFFGSGNSGTAAPSNIPQPGQMWSVFGGSGEAPSTLATMGAPGMQNQPMQSDQNPMSGDQNPMSVANVIKALRGGPQGSLGNP